jgi:hypothetical protein
MIEWNKVTWYSKLAAVIFFLLILPLWTFCLGRSYEKALLAIEEETRSSYTLSPLEEAGNSFRNDTASAIGYSGVEGTVTISPTCPVETEDNPCLPKPYNAYLSITTASGKVVTETVATKNGQFTVYLPVGEYIVKNASQSPLPSFSPLSFTVTKNNITKISLDFDSGIR